MHLLESRVGDHIRAVDGFRRVEGGGWIFLHLAALFVVFPAGRVVVSASSQEEQRRQQQRDECGDEEEFKRRLSIGFRVQ